jgi:GNAT superfamily N-acetyltransferase
MTPHIRLAEKQDRLAIWRIMEPIIRAGETYPLPRDMKDKAALAYWCSSLHTTFVAEVDGKVCGTYYIRPNNSGGGSHIANCGYMVSADAQGKGIARAMCSHSLDFARTANYRGMQFNFVIASNTRAIALWHKMGFTTLCSLPKVFLHPGGHYVDAHVMFQSL